MVYIELNALAVISVISVSYTHLDVYKRQVPLVSKQNIL